MQEPEHPFRKASRICCVVHNRLSHRVARCLAEMETAPIFVESGRNMRRVVRKRRMGLPGLKKGARNSPAEVFYVAVQRDESRAVLRSLIEAAELHIPGHGSVFAQDIFEIGGADPPIAKAKPLGGAGSDSGGIARAELLSDLFCITAILSMPGGGDQCARAALELGTCVPLITLGTGTGMRDRLGLLRITIPPEKEVVRLLVPEYDSRNIMQLLIEGLRLNRPGSGYIYGSPVRAGLLDTRLSTGFQESAASLEQMIAAIDQLKAGTAWRKRFSDFETGRVDAGHRFTVDNQEITVNCMEGRIGSIVAAAMEAGAGGATTFRLRRMLPGGDEPTSAARESAIINVSSSIGDRVIQAIRDVCATAADPADRIQVLDVPAAFNHRRGRPEPAKR